VAIFSRSKAARAVPSFHVPRVHAPNTEGLRLRLSSASAAVARAGKTVSRASAVAISPSWWWRQITSVIGVAALLAVAVISLIAGLAMTWPHH
jgi:hypothetical protein